MSDVRFGRIHISTLYEETRESLGDTLQATGGGIVAGERRPRSFSLVLPLEGGYGDVDPHEMGHRLRRQVRSLVDNIQTRARGVYFNFAPDPDLNGWLIVGGGSLSPEGGGVMAATWTLAFDECYRVASQWTHRAAGRVELYDRRTATTQRDYLGSIFSTDWSLATATSISFLPGGAYDITGSARRVVPHGLRPTLGGSTPVVLAPAHGEVFSYEQDESSMHGNDDVVIYDRRGLEGSAAGGFSAQVLNDRPVAWYRMGAALGSLIVDDESDGGANTATVVGDPVFQATGPLTLEESNYAIGLSQTDSAYLQASDNSQLSIISDLTISLWVKPASGLSGIHGFVGKAATTSGAYGYRFGWDSSTRELKFGVSSNGTSETIATSYNAAITVDTWQHVAVVYDASAGSATFYKNGVEISQVASLPTAIYDNARKLTVAKWEATT